MTLPALRQYASGCLFGPSGTGKTWAIKAEPARSDLAGTDWEDDVLFRHLSVFPMTSRSRSKISQDRFARGILRAAYGRPTDPDDESDQLRSPHPPPCAVDDRRPRRWIALLADSSSFKTAAATDG